MIIPPEPEGESKPRPSLLTRSFAQGALEERRLLEDLEHAGSKAGREFRAKLLEAQNQVRHKVIGEPVRVVSFWDYLGVTIAGLIALCGLGWLMLAGLGVL